MNAQPPALPPSHLHRPLPPDVIAGMTWGPFRYRRYPVFSFRWLMGRFWFSAVAVILYGMLSALGFLANNLSWQSALTAAGYFILGMLLMFTVGPALASWVRHRSFTARREAWLVLVAVVAGFIAAAMADAWTSSQILLAMGEKEIPASERKISQSDEAAIGLARTGGLFLYFAFGGGLAALAYFSERRRLRARTAHLSRLDSYMRLTVLQAQIEPHFLFNTLAAIRPLIRQDAHQAEAAIDALAAHLRATIPRMRGQLGSSESTLGQQLEICGSYLALMKVRMGERFQHEMAVPQDLHTAAFPPLMLLSLVENAIKHGIEPKPGPGKISIHAMTDSSHLRVSVIDDGLGLKPGLGGGLGLANIREQLELRYGKDGSLAVATRPEGGTVAEIAIPRSRPQP